MTHKLYRMATRGDCEACPARHVDLFAGESRLDREHLIAQFRIAAFAPKETIYHMGDPGEYIYLLRFGLVKLVRYSTGGDERIVGLARTGDTIGLAALVGTAYRREAIALSHCELCRVPAELVRSYNRAGPHLVPKLLETYQRNIDLADTFLAELSTGSAHARVARLLLFLAEKHDQAESPLIGREEMGSLLGLTTETVSRIIAEFRREGVLALAGRDRCRCDWERLASYAES
jgi:CRP-like cAMP-binding protein